MKKHYMRICYPSNYDGEYGWISQNDGIYPKEIGYGSGRALSYASQGEIVIEYNSSIPPSRIEIYTGKVSDSGTYSSSSSSHLYQLAIFSHLQTVQVEPSVSTTHVLAKNRMIIRVNVDDVLDCQFIRLLVYPTVSASNRYRLCEISALHIQERNVKDTRNSFVERSSQSAQGVFRLARSRRRYVLSTSILDSWRQKMHALLNTNAHADLTDKSNHDKIFLVGLITEMLWIKAQIDRWIEAQAIIVSQMEEVSSPTVVHSPGTPGGQNSSTIDLEQRLQAIEKKLESLWTRQQELLLLPESQIFSTYMTKFPSNIQMMFLGTVLDFEHLPVCIHRAWTPGLMSASNIVHQYFERTFPSCKHVFYRDHITTKSTMRGERQWNKSLITQQEEASLPEKNNAAYIDSDSLIEHFFRIVWVRHCLSYPTPKQQSLPGSASHLEKGWDSFFHLYSCFVKNSDVEGNSDSFASDRDGSIDSMSALHLDHYLFLNQLTSKLSFMSDFRLLFGIRKFDDSCSDDEIVSGLPPNPHTAVGSPESAEEKSMKPDDSLDSIDIDSLVEEAITEFIQKDGFDANGNTCKPCPPVVPEEEAPNTETVSRVNSKEILSSPHDTRPESPCPVEVSSKADNLKPRRLKLPSRSAVNRRKLGVIKVLPEVENSCKYKERNGSAADDMILNSVLACEMLLSVDAKLWEESVALVMRIHTVSEETQNEYNNAEYTAVLYSLIVTIPAMIIGRLRIIESNRNISCDVSSRFHASSVQSILSAVCALSERVHIGVNMMAAVLYKIVRCCLAICSESTENTEEMTEALSAIRSDDNDSNCIMQKDFCNAVAVLCIDSLHAMVAGFGFHPMTCLDSSIIESLTSDCISPALGAEVQFAASRLNTVCKKRIRGMLSSVQQRAVKKRSEELRRAEEEERALEEARIKKEKDLKDAEIKEEKMKEETHAAAVAEMQRLKKQEAAKEQAIVEAQKAKIEHENELRRQREAERQQEFEAARQKRIDELRKALEDEKLRKDQENAKKIYDSKKDERKKRLKEEKKKFLEEKMKEEMKRIAALKAQREKDKKMPKVVEEALLRESSKSTKQKSTDAKAESLTGGDSCTDEKTNADATIDDNNKKTDDAKAPATQRAPDDKKPDSNPSDGQEASVDSRKETDEEKKRRTSLEYDRTVDRMEKFDNDSASNLAVDNGTGDPGAPASGSGKKGGCVIL